MSTSPFCKPLNTMACVKATFNVARNLEITYILRLFSEFEGILRDYWHAIGRKTKPQIGPLMNRVAAMRGIAAPDLASAHAVREFRNDVIHENLRTIRLPFPECARNLGMFIRWLPMNW